MRRAICNLFVAMMIALPLLAQNGDKKGEVQEPRVAKERIPPSPPLSPTEALKTFKLPPGFRMELVASEPFVEMPVAMQFDADGRIWVVEMRGYMPNLDAIGEKEPVGRVSVLEDKDGDGKADQRTTFLDGLVMPRALSLVSGGVLIAEPPHLWFCRDTNSDLKCDERIEVTNDYGRQVNPEHTANGLMTALDNWIYSANYTFRFRHTDGKWQKEPTIGRGQWGITQDDYGRLFHDSNSDQLRGDLIPSHYVMKRGVATKLNGLNVQIAKDQSVWPSRVNPGVNRGYQSKVLRADGTLARFTAACAPCVYRGENFPKEFYGNAFVCEPAANLVKRNVLAEHDGVITGSNAYTNSEFLTSTDERFRPVNLYNGPDGALYLVDLYHGILQHRTYVTSYLRKQVEDRGLDKPQNQGRIYRIVYENGTLKKPPQLSQATAAELVAALSNVNGALRDTAQRLLIERGDASVVPALQKAAVRSENHLTRLHALWALEGLSKLDIATVAKVLDDKHPKLRAAAMRVAESFLRVTTTENAELRRRVLSLAQDTEADVQIQLALTLGAIEPDDASKALLTSLAQSKITLAKDAAAFGILSQQPSVAAAVAKGPTLSPAEMKRFETGKANYETVCLPCHQPHGLGQEGLAPPLAGSEWVAGTDKRLARIVLHGLRGPITVKNQPFELDMPALGILEDEQIATILTYIRNEWGHSFAPVSMETVQKIREENSKREDAWTQEELLKIQ